MPTFSGSAEPTLCHLLFRVPGIQLRDELAKRFLAEHMVVGNMNAHHPVRGGAGTKVHDEAEQLLEICQLIPRYRECMRIAHYGYNMGSKEGLVSANLKRVGRYE